MLSYNLTTMQVFSAGADRHRSRLAIQAIDIMWLINFPQGVLEFALDP
jgi:hypothetical protein